MGVIWETPQAALVIASGHFTLGVHKGHVRYLKEAATLGKLLVIVNNDNQVRLKGYKDFLPQEERLEIVEAIAGVSKAILSIDEDGSVNKTLAVLVSTARALTPSLKIIFANGGDVSVTSCKEKVLCEALGVELKFGVGGDKVNSTSEIYKAIKK